MIGMGLILWFAAAFIAIIGLAVMFSGSVLWGILILVLAAGVGPGGWTFFKGHNRL